MTEKRFQIDDDGDITEFENQQWIDCWEYGNGKHWDSLCNKLNELFDENEQLKKDVDYWKQVISQYNNELNVFEHKKQYKTECEGIYSNKNDKKSCGFCRHYQLDGMFGVWCDIHEIPLHDAENCKDYERWE